MNHKRIPDRCCSLSYVSFYIVSGSLDYIIAFRLELLFSLLCVAGEWTGGLDQILLCHAANVAGWNGRLTTCQHVTDSRPQWCLSAVDGSNARYHSRVRGEVGLSSLSQSETWSSTSEG